MQGFSYFRMSKTKLMYSKQSSHPKGLIGLIFVVVTIFTSCNSSSLEDLAAQKEQSITDSLEFLNKKDRDSLEKVPLNKRMESIYRDLKKNPGTPSAFVSDFEALIIKAKGTAYAKKLNKTLDSLKAAKKNASDNFEKKQRKKSELELQNAFLDNNLNIKVLVTGKNNTTLKLKYILFNDVWFRKFEKEGYFEKFANQGFKKIILTDGYDYEKWMSYE